MTDALSNPPDWFDVLWEKHHQDLPVWLRHQKKAARQLLGTVVEAMGAYAQTPDGMRQIIAFAKIAQIMKGVQGVIGSPEPAPEQVADWVERLVQRVKP